MILNLDLPITKIVAKLFKISQNILMFANLKTIVVTNKFNITINFLNSRDFFQKTL